MNVIVLTNLLSLHISILQLHALEGNKLMF